MKIALIEISSAVHDQNYIDKSLVGFIEELDDHFDLSFFDLEEISEGLQYGKFMLDGLSDYAVEKCLMSDEEQYVKNIEKRKETMKKVREKINQAIDIASVSRHELGRD